ncbi:MAG: hypothetical protein GXO80_12270 [Chlorobi bacterium]|nr:hypothetical protein [Chlorobiota bacterium]
MENNRNEIDLLELLIKIYLSLKKYWLILLISVLAGIVFTVVKNIYSVKSYSSSMAVAVKQDNDYMYALTFREFSKRYEKNPAEIVTGIINQADELIKSGNISLLAKKMNISKSDLSGLKSISSEFNFKKGEAPGSIVQITANSSEEGVFNKLGTGILYLINNNAFVKGKTSEDSLMLVRIIKKIDIKLYELDSLQSKFLKNGTINDLIIFKNNSFFGESVKLTSLKEKINKDLKNLKEVKLVENFYIPKSKSASMKVPLLLNSIIFLFFGIIIIVFIEFNKKAKSFEQNQKN